MEIKIADMLGNKDFLNLPKTAFLCSRKIPAAIVLDCYDWAIEQRKKGNCIISGFHSTMEKDVLHFLAKGRQPIILAFHKGLKETWDPAIEKLLREKRLLIISPFTRNISRGSEETAATRNRLLLSLAENSRIGHVSPGGNLEKLRLKKTVLHNYNL